MAENLEKTTKIQHEKVHTRPPKLVYLLTFMAAIGGYLFGYNTGVISGAILILDDEWHLSDIWQELIVSATIAGAAIFAILAGILNQRFGRKPVILASSVLFILGAIIMAASNSRGVILLGRLTVGAAIGLSSTTIPPYVCEACPPKGRGSLITVFQLMITFGFFVAGIFNACFNYLRPEISWRLMLAVAGVPAIFQLIGFIFMPESPRWAATRGRERQARQILKKLHHSVEAAEQEYQEIIFDHEQSQKALQKLGGSNALITIVKTARFRRALIVGCSLQLSGLSGINTLMYYAGSIVEMAGTKDKITQMWIIVGIYGVNFFCTFIGMYLVEKIGRRLLLLISVAGVAICLLFLGSSFLAIALTSEKLTFTEYNVNHTSYSCFKYKTCDGCSYDQSCGYCYNEGNTSMTGSCVPAESKHGAAKYGRCSSNHSANQTKAIWAYGFCPTNLSYLPIIGMVLYLFCFSIGLGPMPWTINAEIYPNWARSTGTAIATAVNWSFNLIVSLTFLTLARAISRQGAFYLYAGITTIGLIVFYLIVPETRNLSMEQVDILFKSGWLQIGKKPEKMVKAAYNGVEVEIDRSNT